MSDAVPLPVLTTCGCMTLYAGRGVATFHPSAMCRLCEFLFVVMVWRAIWTICVGAADSLISQTYLTLKMRHLPQRIL